MGIGSQCPLTLTVLPSQAVGLQQGGGQRIREIPATILALSERARFVEHVHQFLGKEGISLGSYLNQIKRQAGRRAS